MPYITSIERSTMKRCWLDGIEVCLKVKFGADGLQLLPEIREIEDLDKLQAVLRVIPQAAIVDDVRRVFAEGKASERGGRYEQERSMPYMTGVERIGMEKGLLAGIEVCLKVKFGADGLQLLPEIREIKDLDKLQAVLQAIPQVASVGDLRRVYSESSPS